MLRKSMLPLCLAAAALATAGCRVHVRATVEPIPVYVEGERNDRRLEKAGWEKLGERTVDGRVDVDTIPVGRAEGRFNRLLLMVEHSDLEMYDVDVEFVDGTHFSPNVRHVFKENSRTRSIDLPGKNRAIRSVRFKYGNLPGGGAAQIELWAR
ncbi:MAG: hypothetical protein U0271_26685 [Polyangiaceae bacterium]